MSTFSTPRGTADILPEEWPHWRRVTCVAEKLAALYGYGRIETPTLSELALFARTTGESTDIVEKEMYSFLDRGGDELALRPEGTAPVMRAYLQHGMNRWPQPVKLYYIERMYRREAPQRGRLREHHQFGCEAIGVEDAHVDVEMIALLGEFYARLGLRGLSLRINSIGDRKCRPLYLRDLVKYLHERESELGDQDRDRLRRNPLRVLDSKEPNAQHALADAPSVLEYLCADCRAHWEKLLHGLGVLGINYTLDHRLVRGLDYYTRTVFEFVSPREGAQNALGGGGRYDGLSEAIGGPPLPGIGFGSGIERLILAMKEQAVEAAEPDRIRVYIAHLGDGTADTALSITMRLHQESVAAVMAFGERSAKAQLKAANASGAAYTVIVGEDELKQGQVALRNMLTGEQTLVRPDELVDRVRL